MFFSGDGSTYVALFCDVADTVLKMAMPENHEVIRTHAGEFLLNLVRNMLKMSENCRFRF